MSIFGNLFNPNAPKVVPAPAAAPAPTTPPVTEPPPAENPPLADYTKLWQNDPNANAANPLAEPLVKVDPKQLASAVSKMNFTASVPPELITKALNGDAAALQQAINLSNQTAFSQMAALSAQMIESAIKQNNDRFDSTLPTKLREQQVLTTKSQNALLENPAVAPLFQATKQQIAQNNPQLSAAEVSAQAEKYFTDFAKVLTQQNTPAPEPKPEDTVNYLDIFMPRTT